MELRSPHIVQHHSFEHIGASLHVVLDRCEGPDLSDHLEARGGRLPLDELRVLAQQMMSAVATLHSVGVMHRDIKPENFRFHDRAATALKLLDFGAAKPASLSPQAHTVTGTLLYVAPEVFDGVYCHSCDLWSVGVVLFQLASGVPPFDTPDVLVLRSLHRDPLLTGDCLFRGEAWRTAPTSAMRFIRGLLTVDPTSRLTALAALSHQWLVHPNADEQHVSGEAGEELSTQDSSEPRSPSSCSAADGQQSPSGLGTPQPSRLLRKSSLLSDLSSIAGDPVTIGEA